MKSAYLFPVIALAAIANAAPAVRADLPGYTGADNCRIAPLEPAPLTETVQWSGACEGGFAVGMGELGWVDTQSKRYRLKATLVRGEVQGEGELKTGDYTYIGTLRQGVPHGLGFFTYQSGMMYEGGVLGGRRDGKGIAIETDRSEYSGEWKDGKPHGWGEIKYAEGGSYSGQWRMGKRHGRGKVVYAGSGRTFEGEFANDLPTGASAPEYTVLRYAFLREDRDQSTTGGWPLDLSWEALAHDQRNAVRSLYPALEQGDDPPYPSQGPLEAFKAIAKLNRLAGAAEGNLRMLVLVGADGKARRAEIFEKPSLGDPEDDRLLADSIGKALMVIPYKPAICRGQPCDMVYPVNFVFTIENASFPKKIRR